MLGVVDIEDGDRIAGDAGADVLGERAVDIDLAAHGDAAGGETGVDEAGLKAELFGEGGPALIGKGDILARALVLLRPVEQGQLKLRHAGQQVGEVLAFAHLLGHIVADGGDARVVRMLLIAYEQVALDGGVAGKEVLGTGTEGDDLEILHTDDRAGNGVELLDHFADILGGADGILGDVALEMAHAEVVGAVEHAAVGVAAAVDEVAVTLGGGNEHAGAVEVLGNQRLGRLGAEVAEEDNQRVDAGGLHVVDSLEHVGLVLNGDGALIDVAAAGLDDGFASRDGQADGEAVAGDRNDAEFYFRNVLHF